MTKHKFFSNHIFQASHKDKTIPAGGILITRYINSADIESLLPRLVIEYKDNKYYGPQCHKINEILTETLLGCTTPAIPAIDNKTTLPIKVDSWLDFSTPVSIDASQKFNLYVYPDPWFHKIPKGKTFVSTIVSDVGKERIQGTCSPSLVGQEFQENQPITLSALPPVAYVIDNNS